MPGGDRTGPQGVGPMTGRAAGYCAGYSVPGYANPGGAGYGRGWGRGGGRGWGRGGGRGWRHWFYATGLPGWQRVTPVAAPGPGVPPTAAPAAQATAPEVAALREQIDEVAGVLQSLKQRLDQLQSTPVEQGAPKANT